MLIKCCAKPQTSYHRWTYSRIDMASEEIPSRESIAICFTQGHKEKLVIEQVQHEGLVDMLFKSGYRLGKIETWVSWQKLCDYQVLVIGAPVDGKFEDVEIKAILEFVNSGGSLLIIADEGGDAKVNSNLNDITKEFGFTFAPDIIVDDVNHVEKSEFVTIGAATKHFITRDVTQIVYASGCSIDVNDEDIIVLVKSGPDAMRKVYENDQWGEPYPAAEQPLVISKRQGQGKIVACGNFSIITSLSKVYGLYAASNFTLVGNIFAWLVNKKALDDANKSDVVHFNIALDQDIYEWMENEIVERKRFESVNDLISFALAAVKKSLDNLSLEGKAGITAEEESGKLEAENETPAPPEPPAPLASAAKASTGPQKPRVQTPTTNVNKSQSQKKRKGKAYIPPERNLVFKAEPESLKKLKEQEQKENEARENDPETNADDGS